MDLQGVLFLPRAVQEFGTLGGCVHGLLIWPLEIDNSSNRHIKI